MAAADDVLEEIEEKYRKSPSPKAVKVVDELIDSCVIVDNEVVETKTPKEVIDILRFIIGESRREVDNRMNEESKRALRYAMMKAMVDKSYVFYGRIGAIDPEDPMADDIEQRTGYSKEVTRRMIETTDAFLDATIEVAELGDSSDEENDINVPYGPKKIRIILEFITEILPNTQKIQRESLDTRNKLRREILEYMVHNPDEDYIRKIYDFVELEKIKARAKAEERTSKGVGGGTKRRRRKKRTRKLK